MKKPSLKTRLFLLTIVVVAVLVGYFLYRNKKAPAGPTPLPTSQQSAWREVVPGVSTKEDVAQKLGKPKVEGESSLEFQSNSPTRNHALSFEEGVVSLIKEVVSFRDATNVSSLTSKYGEASGILYGPDAENGYYLFVYAEKGVAYLGNPATENLLEIWYFPVTSFEDFQERWATSYSESLSPRF